MSPSPSPGPLVDPVLTPAARLPSVEPARSRPAEGRRRAGAPFKTGLVLATALLFQGPLAPAPSSAQVSGLPQAKTHPVAPSAGEKTAVACEVLDLRDEVGGRVPGLRLDALGDGLDIDEWMSDRGVQLYAQSSDLYHGADNGSFLYRPLVAEGDFRIETPLPEQFDLSNATYQKGGLMARFGLDPLAARAMIMLVNFHPNGPSIQFDVRTAQGARATELASTIAVADIDRLAIERQGDRVRVEVSRDGGASWFQPLGGLGGEAIVDSGGQAPLVGMAAASYEPTNDVGFYFTEFEVCGEEGSGPPPPIEPVDGCLEDDFDDDFVDAGWQLLALGDADQVSIAESAGALELSGDGTSLFSSSIDHGAFAYRPVSGDFRAELTVDVAQMGGTGSYRKAGLQLRAGLGDSAVRFLAQLAPDWNNVDGPALQFRYRAATGARGDSTWASNRFGVATRVRFAMERRGDEVRVLYSFDEGASWIQPTGGVGGAATIPGLPDTLYVGSNVVSYDASRAVTGRFDDFALCAPAAVGGLVWWDQDGNARVDDGEMGREKVQLELRTLGNQPIFTTYTDADGRYLFPDVEPGEYQLLIDSPLRISGQPAATTDPDGVEDIHLWGLAIITVAPGQQFLDADFGWRSDYRRNSLCVVDDFEDGVLDTSWTSRQWYLTDFGDAEQVAANEVAGQLLLESDGSSLYAGDDHGGYLFQAWTGDFRMEVEVDGGDTVGGPYAKGGLMVRPAFGSDGARLLAQLVPSWNQGGQSALQFRYRAEAGGPGDGAWASNLFGVPTTAWLAIERVGDVFFVEYSFDGGATWQSPAGGAQGQIALDWPETVLVGLNAVSYSTQQASTVKFDDFSLCPTPAP